MKQLLLLTVISLAPWLAPLAGAGESVEYTIDSGQSVLKISGDFAGAPLVPQAPGTDSVGYFRELNGERDGNMLALDISAPASLFQSVPLLPGRVDGDADVSYGMKAQSPTLGQILISTTRLSFYFSTNYQPPLDVSNGTFAVADVGFFLSDGAFYYAVAGGERHYVDLHGKGAPNRATSPGTLTRQGNLETLTIPVATTFNVPTDAGDVMLSFNGQIVGTRIVPAAVISGSSPNSLFALSVATDANALLIGEPFADGTKGAVHLYYRGSDGFGDWQEHQVLRPTVQTPPMLFGFAIALDNNATAIACYHSPVFVFERVPGSDDWEQTAVLDIPDDTSFTGGNNMSLNEGVLAIGVNSAGSSEEGAVLIYKRDPSRAWHFVTRILASDAEPQAFFGSSVALLGNYLVVGAPGVANDSGAVYVFKREGGDATTWRQLQKILPPTPIHNGEFGTSVATNIGQIIVSEPGDGEISDTAGRVFIYELGLAVDDWQLKHELIPADPLPDGSRFGHRVSIDGNNRDVVVTQLTPAATADVQQPGAAYVFTLGLNGWKQRAKLAPTAGSPPSSFGVSLATGSIHTVVGDYGTSTKPGAAYIYDLTLPQTAPLFLEAPGDLHVDAPPGESAAEVTLEVTVGDEDGSDLDVRWFVDGLQVQSDFIDGGYQTTLGTASLTTTLGPGVHQVRVVADERASDLEAVHELTVTIGDGEDPTHLTVTATPSIIPAQGGRFVLVRLNAEASDPNASVTTWKITRVESSDSGGRRPRLDWIITPNKHAVRLRATTDKRKQDRVYTVHVEARDTAGNVTAGKATVTIIAERNRPGGGR